MPETKEQMLREIERLTEWCDEMYEMLNTDNTIPVNMRSIYIRQATDGEIRLINLKDEAQRRGWA